MTTVQEKLGRETGQKIYLYKQRVFWTAYEQSALILSRHKPLKISVKFVKTVAQQVVSVGCPDTTLGFFSDIFGQFGRIQYKNGFTELIRYQTGSLQHHEFFLLTNPKKLYSKF